MFYSFIVNELFMKKTKINKNFYFFKKKFYFIIIFLYIFLVQINSTELSFLWWNVENFFDTTDDPSKDDSIISQNDFKIKLSGVSKIISKINADFVGLCEIENIFVLKQIAKQCSYNYFYLVEGNDPRGIDIAFLSKEPIIYKSNKHQLTPYDENKHYKFSRDCPEVILNSSNKQLYILLNHLKSQYRQDERTIKKRIAQTFGILDIINHIYKKEKEPYVLVMGDFNCSRYSESLNILQKSGLEILNYSKNNNSFYTYVYRGKKEDLDYFMMNDLLYNKITITTLVSVHSETIRNVSDHYPIILKFKFRQ